jgi:5-methylcytosine-specific restriction enzyme A
MPMAALRPCAQPGCSALVSKGRCVQHAKAKDQARGTAQDRGYDYAWSQYSRDFRAKFPLCGMRIDGQLHPEHSICVREGVMTPAEVVDHIVSMSRGGSKWDPNNHQSLCRACNTAKG